MSKPASFRPAKHPGRSALLQLIGGMACGVAVFAAEPLVDKADDVLSDAGRQKLHARLDEAIGKLTADIERSPKSFDLYSRRGDQRFFRGHFTDAIQDYEKLVELRPEAEASRRGRGIA